MSENAAKSPADRRERKEVFALNERNGHTYWVKIGMAFENVDGSMNLLMDALPVSGRMQIRAYDEARARMAPQRVPGPSEHRAPSAHRERGQQQTLQMFGGAAGGGGK